MSPTIATHCRAGTYSGGSVIRCLRRDPAALTGDRWCLSSIVELPIFTREPTDIRGIAVPGMPLGSPGMEGPNPKEYDIVAYDSDGRTTVYATRQGQTSE